MIGLEPCICHLLGDDVTHLVQWYKTLLLNKCNYNNYDSNGCDARLQENCCVFAWLAKNSSQITLVTILFKKGNAGYTIAKKK